MKTKLDKISWRILFMILGIMIVIRLLLEI